MTDTCARYLISLVEREELDSHVAAIAIAEIRAFADWEKCASELVDALREAWNAQATDAMTLYMVSFVGGIKTEWLKAMPANGFVTSATWPEIGPIEINLKRAEGKSSAQVIKEQGERIAELEAQLLRR